MRTACGPHQIHFSSVVRNCGDFFSHFTVHPNGAIFHSPHCWLIHCFTVYHKDNYPAGNGKFGVDKSNLKGREIGSDFSAKDGWSMYHGEMVPGFPSHPHRGFETITVARDGIIDHSDSLGCRARFSTGDTQWLTAGAGIVHCEMFPLVETEKRNPLELFQVRFNIYAVIFILYWYLCSCFLHSRVNLCVLQYHIYYNKNIIIPILRVILQ